MSDKSGGDILQGNQAMQGNISAQDMNSVAAGGAGVVGSLGGEAFSEAFGMQMVDQSQNQSNTAVSGNGGSDNVHADTTVTA